MKLTDKQIKDVLTDKEYKAYKVAVELVDYWIKAAQLVAPHIKANKKAFHSLAAGHIKNRKLREHIKKHEWNGWIMGINGVEDACPECKQTEDEGHTPNCKRAALLKDDELTV